MRLAKRGSTINTVVDWRRLAPPKSQAHWVRERSAFELARAWCGDGRVAIPDRISEILETNPEIAGTVLVSGEPECRLRFDKLPGEPRNADLAIQAVRNEEAIAVSIEAKADESYGELVSEALAASIERAIAKGRTKGLERIERLARTLLSVHRKGLPGLGHLRYQLLTAAAGTLKFAEGIRARRAVMLVHEFITSKTNDDRHAQNQADLDAFVRRLSAGTVTSVPTGRLVGPIAVPGRPLFMRPATLFVGKVVTNLRVRPPA